MGVIRLNVLEYANGMARSHWPFVSQCLLLQVHYGQLLLAALHPQHWHNGLKKRASTRGNRGTDDVLEGIHGNLV